MLKTLHLFCFACLTDSYIASPVDPWCKLTPLVLLVTCYQVLYNYRILPHNIRTIGVASDWHRSGIGVASEWHRSDIGVASEWHRSGIGVTSEWHRSGIRVASECICDVTLQSLLLLQNYNLWFTEQT